MKLLFWKDTKKIIYFASAQADDFYNEIKPDAAAAYFEETGKPGDSKAMKGKGKKKQSKNASNVKYKLDQIEQRLYVFKEQQKLGVYGKARLHLAFQNRLKELGYSDEVVNAIIKSILFKIQK